MLKKIRYTNIKPKIFDTRFKLNLLRDSDGDGKPNWIDCQPYNRYKQDDDEEPQKRKKYSNRLTREEMINYRDSLRKMARSLEYTNIPDKIKEREKLRKWAEDVDDELYE